MFLFVNQFYNLDLLFAQTNGESSQRKISKRAISSGSKRLLKSISESNAQDFPKLKPRKSYFSIKNL